MIRASTEADAAYERGAVTDGAFTRLPRWTHARVPGTAEHGTVLPAPLFWRRCVSWRTGWRCR